MYKFKKAVINPELDISTIMAAATGSEGRFKSRFIKYAGTSDAFNKSVDVTGQAIDDLRTSAGMIEEQKRGIDRLFLLSERAVNEITKLESESGAKQVENIPLPNDSVRTSHGKKMGYSAFTMSFLIEGLLHFMEESMNLQEALNSRDRIISQMAAQIPSVDFIGGFEEIGITDLIAPTKMDVAEYKKEEKSSSNSSKKTSKKA